MTSITLKGILFTWSYLACQEIAGFQPLGQSFQIAV